MGVILCVVFTIGLAVPVPFAFQEYIVLFGALRSFEAELKDFDFTIYGTTSAFIYTSVVVQNPSEHTFNVLFTQETVTLNGRFILTNGTGGWRTHPTRIPPNSNVTIIIVSLVPKEQVSFIVQQSQKVWSLEIILNTDAPMIGEFLMRLHEEISKT